MKYHDGSEANPEDNFTALLKKAAEYGLLRKGEWVKVHVAHDADCSFVQDVPGHCDCDPGLITTYPDGRQVDLAPLIKEFEHKAKMASLN